MHYHFPMPVGSPPLSPVHSPLSHQPRAILFQGEIQPKSSTIYRTVRMHTCPQSTTTMPPRILDTPHWTHPLHMMDCPHCSTPF